MLQAALPDIVSRLSFGRSMRWMPHSDVAFSRPVRWLLALHGDVAVPMVLGSLQSAPQTRLLRQSKTPTAPVASAADYPQVIASAGIVLGQEERRAQIWSAVQAAAKVRRSSTPASCFLNGGFRACLSVDVCMFVTRTRGGSRCS